MSDFPFVGETYVAWSTYVNAEECINWYVIADQSKADGERGKYALYPSPGTTLLCALDNVAPVRGMHPLPGDTLAIVVAGNTVYKLTPTWAYTRVGTLSTSTGPVSITDNGTSAYITDGTARYYYTWGTSTFATIADGGFTGGGQCDVVDNFVVYTNPNSNQWGCTNVGSVTSNGLNFAATLTAPGNVQGIIASKREVFVLCERTSEVWYDVGDYPFPFQAVPGSSIQHGCKAPGSISRLGESFAFLAQDTRGDGTVVMMDGYNAMPISTYAVAQAIKSYSVTSDAIACTYQINGNEFYELTFPTADVTWVYDASMGLWHKRASMDAQGVLHRSRTNCAMFFAGTTVVGDYENGQLYALQTNTYTDNGMPMKRIRRCRHLTGDNLNRVFHSRLQIQFEPGVGLQAGQGSDPQAMLRISYDGGSTWPVERWTKIGKVGKYQNRAIWRRLGAARDRVYEVSMTDPVKAVIISANIRGDEGES